MKTWNGAVCLLLAGACVGRGQVVSRRWQAVSSTAMGVTGNVVVKSNEITMHGSRIPIKLAQHLDDASLQTAARLFSLPSAKGASGALYTVQIAASRTFRNGNTLCGRDDVHFAVLMFSPPDQGGSEQTMSLALFSGDRPPDLHTDAFTRGTSLCGTYGYQEIAGKR